MRVLHASEVHWGGVVGLVQDFIEQQVARGDEVMLLAPDTFPTTAATSKRDWRFARKDPLTYPAALRRLREVVSEFRPDVVHLHSFMAGFLGRLPGAVLGVPVVYQPHAWSFDLRDEKTFGWAVKSAERLAGRRTDMLVTNCEAEIAEGRSVGVRSPAASLGIIVDATRFAPVDAQQQEAYRRQCGVTSAHMLVCVGRLIWQKGQDLLVASWERSRPPDTELVLVGPGETDALRKLAPTQWGTTIRAVGEHGDVRPWIWASDALVLSSRYEGTAIVIGEAMACARPVLATLVNGAEYIQSAERDAAGVVVGKVDSDALVTAAGEVLADPPRIAAMAAVGRRRSEEEFTAAVVVSRLDRAYRDAIAHRARGRA